MPLDRAGNTYSTRGQRNGELGEAVKVIRFRLTRCYAITRCRASAAAQTKHIMSE